jgi:hypothetical protein
MDLSVLLNPAMRHRLDWTTRILILRYCGGVLWPDGDGWVVRFARGDRIAGRD